jgi:hypothetical protein
MNHPDQRIQKGPQAGKLEVGLMAPDGEREVMAFAPEEKVKVVGKDPEAGKGKGSSGKVVCVLRIAFLRAVV